MTKPVLMLNSDLSPVKIPIQKMSFEQAINRVFAETCYVVLSYDHPIKTAHPAALDRYNLRYWPSVIARKNYLKRKHTATCSKHGIYVRDKATCQYCGNFVPENEKTMEHYIPKSKSGPFTWENILLACKDCNSKKGDSMPEGRWKPLKQPYKPEYWELVSNELHIPLTIHDSRWLTFLPEWQAEVKVVDPFQ